MAKRTSKKSTASAKAGAKAKTSAADQPQADAQAQAGGPDITAPAPVTEKVVHDAPPQPRPLGAVDALAAAEAAALQDEAKRSIAAGLLQSGGIGDYQMVIIGPRQGFRRCGRSFGPEEVVIPMEELTDVEAEVLENEPRLMVKIERKPVALKA